MVSISNSFWGTTVVNTTILFPSYASVAKKKNISELDEKESSLQRPCRYLVHRQTYNISHKIPKLKYFSYRNPLKPGVKSRMVMPRLHPSDQQQQQQQQ